MGSPSKALVEMESALRLVIENLIDAQEGMQKIGEEVKDEALKSFFLAEGLKRAQYRGELENILHQEGVRDVRESGTAAGAFVRAWTGFRAKLGGGEAALLEAAEEAEQNLIEAYKDALGNDLPAPIRDVLTEQVLWTVASHKAIRVARESRGKVSG